MNFRPKFTFFASNAFLLFLTFSTIAQAEYRVFTLHIINKSSQVTRQVETTLDPIQYTTFFPLKKGEDISYIETWRCLGRTDSFKAHCDNPRLKTPADEVSPAKAAAKLD